MGQRDLLLRKQQRQNKVEDFAKTAGAEPRLRLALARMRGADALRAAAVDATVPAGDRELAGWATGDLRDGLMALRRRPACRAIAEGWLLLLKGDAEAALAAFASATEAEPRRASAGAAVALAALGRRDEAAARWMTVGPVPRSVFPAAGALTRTLANSEAGWDPSTLRRLLTTGTAAEVEAARRDCPHERIADRAYLALRLGDLHWRADRRDQSCFQHWQQAWPLPALRADILKRRFWAELTQREGKTTSLADLHRLLGERDPAEARLAVDAMTRELPHATLVRIANPWHRDGLSMPDDDAPVEWILVWLRQAAPLLGALNGLLSRLISLEAGVAMPPAKLAHWRPWLRQLDAAYGDDATYLEGKLGLLAHFNQQSEIRLACFQMLLACPERRDEFLSAWCRAAAIDRRSRKHLVAELAQLDARFPGAMDLALFAREVLSAPEADAAARAAAMPPARAAVWRWISADGACPGPADLGQDDEADLHLMKALGERDCPAAARLCMHQPDHMHRLLGRIASDYGTYAAEPIAKAWSRADARDWRAWFQLGNCQRRRGDAALESLRKALALIPAERPERCDLEHWLEDAEEVDDLDDRDRAPYDLGGGGGDDASQHQPAAGHHSLGEPAATFSIRDAARDCGMEGAIAIAGLDEIVDDLDEGMPLELLEDRWRRQCHRLLASLLPHLRGKALVDLGRLHQELAT